MTKIMTPSVVEMTDGQIDKASELYRAMLRKHRGEFGSESVQQVLGQPEFVGEMVGVLRRRVEAVMKKILTFLRTVSIAAQPSITTSEEYFKEAGVVWANDTFRAEFYGLEVPANQEAELAVLELKEDSLDKPILDELGDKAEVSVSQFKAFLNAYRGSSEWFIFYLKGKNGKLWAVDAYWYAVYGGWSVGAYSVAHPDRWRQGSRVVSQV